MTFATFFTDETRTIRSQFSPPHTQDLQPTTSTAQTPIFSFCLLTEAEVSKLLLSSHPTTCPLDPIPSHLLQAISPTFLPALTHIINTSLLTGIFPTAFKQARVTPLLKKTTLNTSLIENFRLVSLLSFIAKTLKWVVFNQVSLFLSQNNKLDAKQSGFRSGHSTETALLCHWSPANCKSRFQIISPHSAGSVCHFWYCQSSDPPVHPLITGYHWDSTSLVWILSHWLVFQGGLGRVGIQSTSIGHWGFPRARFLDPSSSPHTLHHWLSFMIQLSSSTITPSASVRNLGVIFDDQLTFKEHIAKTARSCRFALHNIRKIRPFLTEHAPQLLVPLSFLGWTTAMLFWLDFHQTQSNLYKWFRMQRHDWSWNEPKRAHVTPLFIRCIESTLNY